jgi:hypothetical protein
MFFLAGISSDPKSAERHVVVLPRPRMRPGTIRSIDEAVLTPGEPAI